nr:AmmeMemoRadiSam system protein A [uncultured Holophaga sp.]
MDPHTHLARLALEHGLATGRPLEPLPEDCVRALSGEQGGAFVSLHTRGGELRGCIGTLAATRSSLAEEIAANALAAGTRDHRFEPVTLPELPGLVIQVDVLSEPEPVSSSEDLDPMRYGVIVSGPGGRRGVLLPDLPGIASAREQIRIAARKAGLDPDRDPCQLSRFTVIRHTED